MFEITQTRYKDYNCMGVTFKKGVPVETEDKKLADYAKTLDGFTVKEVKGGKNDGKGKDDKDPGTPPANDPPAGSAPAGTPDQVPPANDPAQSGGQAGSQDDDKTQGSKDDKSKDPKGGKSPIKS